MIKNLNLKRKPNKLYKKLGLVVQSQFNTKPKYDHLLGDNLQVGGLCDLFKLIRLVALKLHLVVGDGWVYF